MAFFSECCTNLLDDPLASFPGSTHLGGNLVIFQKNVIERYVRFGIHSLEPIKKCTSLAFRRFVGVIYLYLARSLMI